ncbi:hypothetical protein BD414DRAFT_577694 [Trametes punicea]|nr:hypothetical protein BD414DRAFT_577694 [Trametes punicea]
MAYTSKRKLSESGFDEDWLISTAGGVFEGSLGPPLAADHVAKYRRTASGSDFSTFEIKHALDMPPSLTTSGPSALPVAAASQPDEPTPELHELLDLSALDSSQAISNRFEQIASELLHSYCIEITREEKAEQLEVLELEFYLYKAETHEDPFTHSSAEQRQSGRWYFHRPPHRSNDPVAAVASPAGYRGGTRKGLDLTIGRPAPPVTSKFFLQAQGGQDEAGDTSILRGGILLRSIRRVSDGKVISGPSLLVDELLRLSGASEITELVAVNWDGDIAAFPPSPATARERVSTMWLRRRPDTDTAGSSAPSQKDRPRIFRSPRIGLDISHPSVVLTSASTHPRVKFVSRPYRFFVSPHLLTANGRGQTFLGVYDALQKAGYCESDEELLSELARLTAVKGPTAAKYWGALKAGLESGELGEWVGPKGKTVLSSVTAWLKMMGTLRRLQLAAASE